MLERSCALRTGECIIAAHFVRIAELAEKHCNLNEKFTSINTSLK